MPRGEMPCNFQSLLKLFVKCTTLGEVAKLGMSSIDFNQSLSF